MVSIATLFRRFSAKKILIAGDCMLDRYTFGISKRISPEAPVPVVLVDRQENRAGGAGNVALNVAALGMQPMLLGRVGMDPAGCALREALSKQQIDTRWLIDEPSYYTPQKERLIASAQQVVRIDYERFSELSSKSEAMLIAALPEILADVSLVAISDYAKGFLSPRLLRALIDAARKAGIAVLVDPKGNNLQKYRGATLLKPNLGEALAAAGFSSSLEEAASHILRQTEVDVLMVTRSEAGISLFYPDGRQEDHPVQAREVKDVTGAGDTVLAMLAAAMACGISLSDATQLANTAAQVAIEKVGCVTVSLSDVARRMIDQQAHHKIFDDEHISVLQQALAGKKVVCINLAAPSELNHTFFTKLHAAARDGNEVVVCVAPSAADELVSTLVSFKEVSYLLMTNQPDLLASSLL